MVSIYWLLGLALLCAATVVYQQAKLESAKKDRVVRDAVISCLVSELLERAEPYEAVGPTDTVMRVGGLVLTDHPPANYTVLSVGEGDTVLQAVREATPGVEYISGASYLVGQEVLVDEDRTGMWKRELHPWTG